MNILIVDDLAANRRLLTAQLEAEEHTVFQACNGLEAVGLLENAPVELIISDILMPVMDGYRLCAEVRGSERHRHLPFIFYTATYTSPADEKLCYELGADAYVRKPVPVADLLATIGRVLAGPRRKPVLTMREQNILKEYSERLVFKLEQKNLELAAALDQLRLQATALDSAADAILITDVQGTISWVNRAFCAGTGYSADEATGRPAGTLRMGLQDAVFTGAFWDSYPEPVWRGESTMRPNDGTVHDNELTVTPVRALDDRITHIVGVLHDVTERRAAEERLRESELRFRGMLANLELIAVMLDRDARITYCNDHLLRLTGWQREQIVGGDWFEIFVPSEIHATMHAMFSTLLNDAPNAWHHENEILTRAGKRLLIQWNNSVLRSPSGEIIGTATIGQDVTDKRSLERQIVVAQRLESLGTLAGGIAHDLNNLLMPILMGATLLKRLEPTEQSLKAIENIERSVKRGSDLVKQVLLFARGAETSRRAVHVGDVVREVESIAASTFPKNITIELVIARDLGLVMGDATQLSQVLLNLCVNARDAMPRGGQLFISATNMELTDHDARLHGGEHGGSYVVLEVTDTGEGMSREIVDRVFDPFFTTKEVGQGTGLGLSTVQGIVSSHGGFISVSSRVGEGSTFAVYLPKGSAEPEAPAVSDVAEEEPRRGNGELVMVVDDDLAVASITGQTLEAFGYRVLAAEDGAEAIGLYSRHHTEIALVLTDMAMPVIDGHALIAALRRIDPAVRIIASTANAGAAQMTKLAKTGVAHVLAKPYTADELLHRVADVLGAEEK